MFGVLQDWRHVCTPFWAFFKKQIPQVKIKKYRSKMWHLKFASLKRKFIHCKHSTYELQSCMLTFRYEDSFGKFTKLETFSFMIFVKLRSLLYIKIFWGGGKVCTTYLCLKPICHKIWKRNIAKILNCASHSHNKSSIHSTKIFEKQI